MYPYTLDEFCSFYESLRKSDDKDKHLNSERLYRDMELKNSEMDDFFAFSQNVLKLLPTSANTDGWYLGSLLPPFPDIDSILFSKEMIIDVELKREIGTQNEQSILNKFKKHNHLINKIKDKFPDFTDNTQILYFAYIRKENRLVKFNLKNSNYSDVDFKYLVRILSNIKNPIEYNPIKKLSKDDFLISPLNDIEGFLKGEYYLTDYQETIEKKILNSNGKGIFGIKGKAGSGKSLIAYDLIKKFDNKKKILFIFPGELRDTQRDFEKHFPNLTFSSGKGLSSDKNLSLDTKDIIIIDEAQRLYYGYDDSTLNVLRKWIELNYKSKLTIFCYDSQQALGPKDCGNLIDSMFEGYSKDKKGERFELKESIRSNPEIIAFVNRLYDLSNSPKKNITPDLLKKHVEVKFFETANQAIAWMKYKINTGYTCILPTGGKYKPASWDKFSELSSIAANSHGMLGEESNKIITYIDESYYYDNNGKLCVKNGTNYYYLDNELYVNLTRARDNLAIAVVENFDIYLAIIDVIFNGNGNNDINNTISKCNDINYLNKWEELINKRKKAISNKNN